MSEVTQELSSASKTTRKSNRSAPSAEIAGSQEARRSSSRDTKTYSPQKPRNGKKDEGDTSKPTKKRRKVNHACLYCRRSHMTCDQDRPCSRCIKRDIPHLCRDEPRDSKKGKHDPDTSQIDDAVSPKQQLPDQLPLGPTTSLPHTVTDINMQTSPMLPPVVTDASDMVVPPAVTGQQQPNAFNQSSPLHNDWANSQQAHLQDMQNFHPNYMFNASEVTNEYNLLGDFLSNSLLDDGAFYQGDDPHMQFTDPSLANIMGPVSTPNPMFPSNGPFNLQTNFTPPIEGSAGSSSSAKKPSDKVDKAKERYYMTAADPGGTEPPEERINKLLKAKYDAGLLKPFNYVKGYSRLNQYMEYNLKSGARQRILQQLDMFRPQFRKRMQKLTDIELVKVEMWFERKLMEYDRVFASMAIPACCWRRTGEIFRGNREMSELIGVPIERLRDGKISIHEIFAEDSLVCYWEKFGAIAFDESQKGILTSCSLKSPNPETKDLQVRCCFSFTIQRDTASIPSLIIGNFLPVAELE